MRQITFQKVLESNTVPLAGLGEQALTPDGRLWRYVKANEAISLGHATTRTANSDQDTLASSSDPAGNRTVVTQSGASFTAGDFADAYLLIDAGTGSGQFAKIKTNDATRLFLYPDYALGTALDVSDSDGVIVRPHLAEKTAITVLNQVPIGVAQVAIASGSYGWVLERGPGVVIAGEALTANEQCTPGDDTEGEVKNIANGETPDDISSFGRCLVANGSADEGAMVDVHVL